MYYPDEIIEEVRSRSDIVDVISSYVNLKRKGSSYFGLCPFHSEKTGSFSVSPGKQMYYCFGCGAGGNVISFIMQYENLSFPEAVQMLAKRGGISLPEREYTEEDRKEKSLKDTLLEINKTAATHFFRLLGTPEGASAYQYLHGKRKLTDETIRRFGLGYSSRKPGELYRYLKGKGYSDDMLRQSGLVTIEERGARDKFWNRAMFPIMDVNSRVIGFGGRVMGDGEPKYLNSPETKLFDKSRNLYGLNYARTSRKDYFLLCEGYLDVISLHQAGFTNAVASLGTALTAQHCLVLKRYVKQVVLTYDSDGAGVNAARRAIPLLKEAGITARVLSMKPHKDPDEFINALGAEEFQKRIDSARNAFLWEIDQTEKMYRTDDPGEKTRFYHDAAEKLAQFDDALERGNYVKTVAREHMIPEEELRRLVNTIGAEKHARPSYDREPKAIPAAGKKAGRDDASLKSQKLFLCFLADDPSLMKETERFITPEDFTDPFYRGLAERLYAGIRSGTMNAAGILSAYADDDEKERKAAAVFHAAELTDAGPDEKRKAAADCIRRIKLDRLNKEAKKAATLEDLQRILKEQSELKAMRIDIRGDSND